MYIKIILTLCMVFSAISAYYSYQDYHENHIIHQAQFKIAADEVNSNIEQLKQKTLDKIFNAPSIEEIEQ